MEEVSSNVGSAVVGALVGASAVRLRGVGERRRKRPWRLGDGSAASPGGDAACP